MRLHLTGLCLLFATLPFSIPALAQDDEVGSIVGRASPESLEAPQDAAGELQNALAAERDGERQVREGNRLLAKAAREKDAADKEKLEGRAKAAFESAVQELTAAIPIRPDTAKSYALLGEALRRLGRFPEALRIHEVALRRLPDDDTNLRGWLETLLAVGRIEDAMAGYAPLSSADPARAKRLLAALDALEAEHRKAGESGGGLSALGAWLKGIHATEAAAGGGR